MMKLTLACFLVFLVGCANAPRSGNELAASRAQQALADFVTAHPDVFVSPGRAESAAEILKSTVGSQSSGNVKIAWFSVDLDGKTYQLFHAFGKPGSGWFENWVWNGSFSQSPDGKWKVEQPKFTKDWGE